MSGLFIPISAELRKLKQGDSCKFQASMGYTANRNQLCQHTHTPFLTCAVDFLFINDVFC